jgi:hypothetical protein
MLTHFSEDNAFATMLAICDTKSASSHVGPEIHSKNHGVAHERLLPTVGIGIKAFDDFVRADAFMCVQLTPWHPGVATLVLTIRFCELTDTQMPTHFSEDNAFATMLTIRNAIGTAARMGCKILSGNHDVACSVGALHGLKQAVFCHVGCTLAQFASPVAARIPCLGPFLGAHVVIARVPIHICAAHFELADDPLERPVPSERLHGHFHPAGGASGVGDHPLLDAALAKRVPVLTRHGPVQDMMADAADKIRVHLLDKLLWVHSLLGRG